MAGSADGDQKQLDIGTNMMIAGIVWQVATLMVFGTLVVDYVIRTRRDWGNVPESAKMLASKKSFKFFTYGVLTAFITVFLRCVYRIAEMVEGWANPIMRDEPSFTVFEGL